MNTLYYALLSLQLTTNARDNAMRENQVPPELDDYEELFNDVQNALKVLPPEPPKDATACELIEAAMGRGEKLIVLTTAQAAHLLNLVSEGAQAAQAVVDNWSSGDLAGAVNGLQNWKAEAEDELPARLRYDWHVCTDDNEHVGLYRIDASGEPEDDFVQAAVISAHAQEQIEVICNRLNADEITEDEAAVLVRALDDPFTQPEGWDGSAPLS
ncbi:hypothetical protein KIKIMORA_04820 [Brevundimonas phage vB_BpoS-Kikimora]|uniref:Uncharacterized protein n=1 Tax=Brevundimonas phage vB_BpoS-Kikimora TaxID=2948601 RepID=A0A9E7MSA4_9CAUD|nr:hypothetical protein KIKIMORA_04820 [Brevundimonas phage vB_BpoS-Kikimora]